MLITLALAQQDCQYTYTYNTQHNEIGTLHLTHPEGAWDEDQLQFPGSPPGQGH